MKRLTMAMLVVMVLMTGFTDCYAKDEISESEAREQIEALMEWQLEADSNVEMEELALQEYDMDCMVKTYEMSKMLITYNKGGKFKDTLSDVVYFVPGIAKWGDYCYFSFEVKDGKIESKGGAYLLSSYFDCRFDKSKYPQLEGEKVRKVEYGYNAPYGSVFVHVETDKNEYMIQYDGHEVDSITGIKSGELLYADDFYEIMNRYYDETIKYEFFNPKDMQFGKAPYLRKEPLESYGKPENRTGIPKIIYITMAILVVAAVLMIVIRRNKITLNIHRNHSDKLGRKEGEMSGSLIDAANAAE